MIRNQAGVIDRRSPPVAAAANPLARGARWRAALAVSTFLALAGCTRTVPAATGFNESAAASCRGVVPDRGAAVRWTMAARAADRADIARWCATVGPVLFQPEPRNVSAHLTDRVALVSWNVHVGSGDVADLVRRLRVGEFTDGQPIEHFALLLQEAYRRDTAVPPQIPHGFPAPSRIAARTGRGPDISRLADELGLAVLYVPSMRNGLTAVDAEDRGNAIVASLRLADPEVVELPLGRQRRAVAVSSISGRTSSGAPWRLRVADVHLDTTLAMMSGGPFEARRQQAAALIDALAGEVPTIVAGDLNTWRGDAEPAVALLRRAFPNGPIMPQVATWSGPLGLHAQLDHVFARGAVNATNVVRLPGRFGSDHYPLMTTVRVEPATR